MSLEILRIELAVGWFWVSVVLAALMAVLIGVNQELSERRWRRERALWEAARAELD